MKRALWSLICVALFLLISAALLRPSYVEPFPYENREASVFLDQDGKVHLRVPGYTGVLYVDGRYVQGIPNNTNDVTSPNYIDTKEIWVWADLSPPYDRKILFDLPISILESLITKESAAAGKDLEYRLVPYYWFQFDTVGTDVGAKLNDTWSNIAVADGLYVNSKAWIAWLLRPWFHPYYEVQLVPAEQS